MTNRYTQHPLSAAFPAMSAEDYVSLRADISANGQRDPIVIHEGMVLDGWHRYSSHVDLGTEDQALCEALPDGIDPVAFVLSRNLHRRHLSASQRAMAVAACATWARVGRPRNSAAAAPLPADENSAAAAPLPEPQTLDELAETAGVSRRTMASAGRVQKQAEPEVIQAVTDGRMTVEQAAAVSKLPAAEQAAAAEAPPPPAKKAAPKKAPATDYDADAVIASLRGQLAEAAERIEELQGNVQALMADNESMAKVFEADDKVAEATKESARLRAEVGGLRERINGLMAEKNEAIRMVKHWRGRADKAEQAVAKQAAKQAA